MSAATQPPPGPSESSLGFQAAELRCGEALDPNTFGDIRRRMELECCKWDAQIGDVTTLANFPLILAEATWRNLAELSERLTIELQGAESEMPGNPALLAHLSLPTPLFKLFRKMDPARFTPGGCRTFRYDFHPTSDGWTLSEVNSDVPGGFTEASSFTAMMADATGDGIPAGMPIRAWADGFMLRPGSDNTLALLTAPGYMEDHQVTAYLGKHLRERGWRTHHAKPDQITWRDGTAYLESKWHQGHLEGIARFYQAEWLATSPANSGWESFFEGGITAVSNPGIAVISESKRFPLTWDSLKTQMANWRGALPETRDPREIDLSDLEHWVLKTAYCNTGDTVATREWLSAPVWAKVLNQAKSKPELWVAQKRFESAPVETPAGPMNACIGVYVIDGRASGIYGRLSPKPWVDYSALDAAVLIESKG